MDNPIQQKRLENTLLIAKSFGLENNNIEKSLEIFTEDSLLSFAQDLQKGLDNGSIDNDYFEKAVKDLTKLQKKIITNSQGHQQTVYVRVHDDGAEHHFKHEDKVKFTHGGKEVVGHIKSLKHHEKFDKFGTAEIHDKEGNKYSKSLRQIEHHHVPEESKDDDFQVKSRMLQNTMDAADRKVRSILEAYGIKSKDSTGADAVNHLSRITDADDRKELINAGKVYDKAYDEHEALPKPERKKLSESGKSKAIVSTDKPEETEASKAGISEKEYAKLHPGTKAELAKTSKVEIPLPKGKIGKRMIDKDYDEVKKLADKGDEEAKKDLKRRDNTLPDRVKKDSDGEPILDKTEEKPKLFGVEAINTKQKQLKAIQEQIKNHDTGVKKLQSGELHNLKEKAKLIQTIINKLSDKVDSREGAGAKK